MLRVLILGGTSEARALAALLADDFAVVSSLAGRVANPALPVGDVRIGGFGGADGLTDWLVGQGIEAIIDATHPFAARITASAQLASQRTGIPLLGLRRPGWPAEPQWHRVASVAGAADVLGARGPSRVFLTTGRRDLLPFASLDRHSFLIRTVDPPEVQLPPNAEVLLARGPYTLEGEVALMREHRIDVLVSKDSGGELTRAKLVAAQQLGVTVVMVDRPAYSLSVAVHSPTDARQWLLTLSGDPAPIQPG